LEKDSKNIKEKVKMAKFYIGNIEYWVFTSPYGYQVLCGPAHKTGSVTVLAPENGKFYKSRTTATKKLRSILKAKK